MRKIVEAIKEEEEAGRAPTFTSLLRRLQISSRTLAKYLNLLEGSGVVTRKRVGELAPIALDEGRAERLLKAAESGETGGSRPAFLAASLNMAVDLWRLLIWLAESRGRRTITCEFFVGPYVTFVRRFKWDILGTLIRVAELQPLTPRHTAIYLALFWFLRSNENTFTLEEYIFFPVYDWPEEALREMPPEVQAIITHVSSFIKNTVFRADSSSPH
jgi:hypothetical protein